MHRRPTHTVQLACLTALWGLAATPRSFAVCINAQDAAAVRWDPILHQQWRTTTDCEHPERPAQSRLIASSWTLARTNPTANLASKPTAPLVVRAGERVHLWGQEANVRMEITGIAEESGAIGSFVHVRLTQPTAGVSEQQLRGIVRGPSNVEMQR
ncbi:flagella basal body P-ring formation protein FlgA [Edaphobacter bradus]|uniref:flagella basal body P-ring formation protein FlgA n=1 Tax=Edaphobacter bradus TaxID=2259016 RepID=UPI0021DF8BF7|nr:flagella basal body P-ring formation protein FlgA [Edaphobacter bradus]